MEGNDFLKIIATKLLQEKVYKTHTFLKGKWTLFPFMIVLSLFSIVESCE